MTAGVGSRSTAAGRSSPVPLAGSGSRRRALLRGGRRGRALRRPRRATSSGGRRARCAGTPRSPVRRHGRGRGRARVRRGAGRGSAASTPSSRTPASLQHRPLLERIPRTSGGRSTSTSSASSSACAPPAARFREQGRRRHPRDRLAGRAPRLPAARRLLRLEVRRHRARRGAREGARRPTASASTAVAPGLIAHRDAGRRSRRGRGPARGRRGRDRRSARACPAPSPPRRWPTSSSSSPPTSRRTSREQRSSSTEASARERSTAARGQGRARHRLRRAGTAARSRCASPARARRSSAPTCARHPTRPATRSRARRTRLIELAGGRARFVACDVDRRRPGSRRRREAVEPFGRLDVAVANAGINLEVRDLVDEPFEDYLRIVDREPARSLVDVQGGGAADDRPGRGRPRDRRSPRSRRSSARPRASPTTRRRAPCSSSCARLPRRSRRTASP